MNKQYFIPDKDGFYGVYYSNKEKSEQVMIAMLGDSSDDCMSVSSVKWLQCINHVSEQTGLWASQLSLRTF